MAAKETKVQKGLEKKSYTPDPRPTKKVKKK
jgi:hypothetical protein